MVFGWIGEICSQLIVDIFALCAAKKTVWGIESYFDFVYNGKETRTKKDEQELYLSDLKITLQ